MRHLSCLPLATLLLAAALAACTTTSQKLPGDLRLEEHLLKDAPTLEPLGFQPTQGTQDEILGRHASDRAAHILVQVDLVDGNPALSSLGESNNLMARVVPPAEDPLRQIVRLYRGDEVIFTADAGLPSPAVPLQALWTYDGHWALELLYADPETWGGQLYVDGEPVNTSKGYEEAFGFQLLSGKPFFFYQRDGKIGISYDGQEADLGYTEIPHYRCCGESVLNPVQAQDMVAFFAERDGRWYYVELGQFDS